MWFCRFWGVESRDFGRASAPSDSPWGRGGEADGEAEDVVLREWPSLESPWVPTAPGDVFEPVPLDDGGMVAGRWDDDSPGSVPMCGL